MEIEVNGKKLEFSGGLDETTNLSALLQACDKACSGQRDRGIEVDFSKVVRANSSGVLVWLKFLEAAKAAVRYVNCPVWLVRQFNMVQGFFNNNSVVQTIQIPYYCETTDASTVMLFELGKDIPLKAQYKGFELPTRELNGQTFTPDVNAEQYFAFIAANVNEFRKSLNVA